MNGCADDGKPIFVQIAVLLENAILNGAYAEESQIPSITEFSVAYKINPATALKGVNILVEAGLLYKKRGMGMFVAAGARKKLVDRRKESFFCDYIQPLLTEAKRLSINEQKLVEMIERGDDNYEY
ncbi:MAG: GntR family transcriptional regulator [Clostridiales bacterium]